jgi:hypothetical protein
MVRDYRPEDLFSADGFGSKIPSHTGPRLRVGTGHSNSPAHRCGARGRVQIHPSIPKAATLTPSWLPRNLPENLSFMTDVGGMGLGECDVVGSGRRLERRPASDRCRSCRSSDAATFVDARGSVRHGDDHRCGCTWTGLLVRRFCVYGRRLSCSSGRQSRFAQQRLGRPADLGVGLV